MIFVDVPTSVLKREIEALELKKQGAAPTVQTRADGMLRVLWWVLQGGTPPSESL